MVFLKKMYFNNKGYQVSSKVMNCFDYGIQTRRRAIIIGNLLSKEFEFQKIKKVVSVHEAILIFQDFFQRRRYFSRVCKIFFIRLSKDNEKRIKGYL